MTLEEYRNNLLPSQRDLFDDFVGIGIRKTIHALLDADVEDSVIQRVVVDHWNISRNDFCRILIEAKKEAALYYLWEHLTFQAYSPDEAEEYISSNMIGNYLLRNHELLKLWKNPEKLLKAIQKEQKNKEK